MKDFCELTVILIVVAHLSGVPVLLLHLLLLLLNTLIQLFDYSAALLTVPSTATIPSS